jgi:hypothetical protein
VKYVCCDELRRTIVRGNRGWNGIDYLEVVDHPTQRTLEVHFVNDLSSLTLKPENFRIEGGERIVNIAVRNVTAGPADDVLTVEVDQAGDFSPYTLRLVASSTSDVVPSGIDPQLASIQFSFKVECPTPFDCAPRHLCPTEPQTQPVIDYLAKDYASFRRVMLDRMATVLPQWTERNPADVGVALVEALAYRADQLSYQQDAVATEAYLGTARRRISVRRHARLMDYFISEGCNARTWVQIQVSADVTERAADDPAIPIRTKFTTQMPGRPAVLAGETSEYERTDVIFEAMEPVRSLYVAHNAIPFYTWSDQRCCLPKGATTATLKDNPEKRLLLRPGDVLIFEEVIGPETGVSADADPRRRHAVRLSMVVPEANAVMAENKDGVKVEVERTPNPMRFDPVTGEAVVEISWHEEDALPFPLCLSATITTDNREARSVAASVARGNVVLTDHGMTVLGEVIGTVPKPFLVGPRPTTGDRCLPTTRAMIPPRFRPTLLRAPLTHAAPVPDQSQSARAAMHWSLRDVQPVLTLFDLNDSHSNDNKWTAQRDLLNSSADTREFVVEIENDGTAVIRFGNDVHGRRPEPGTAFTATYRVGNGRAGNIGADSLKHIVLARPEITMVRNPLPARGGQEPESIEEVRQKAPIAYRVQERAVTPADYAEVTERRADVQRAAATFRWTGSWHTVFLTVDRLGSRPITPEYEQELRGHVDRYRMAGYDVEVDGPRFVSLELALHVCVASDHFRSDVERELLEVLGNRDLPNGKRGLFHPDSWTFGQPVYLSAIYAAAHRVAGVDSVTIRRFRRQGVPQSSALGSGRLDIGRLEIARLDNDRNFPEHGQLTISLGGGK